MSCKSALYAANTADQALTANANVNFGNIIRRYGCSCNLSGGTNVTIASSGYYDLDASFTITGSGTTAAPVTVSLYKDGVAIPGASATVTATSTESFSVTIPAIARQMCNCMTGTITAVVDAACTITNAAITARKL